MICPNCETEQSKNAATCNKCGYNFYTEVNLSEDKPAKTGKKKSVASANKSSAPRKRRKFSPQAKLVLILIGVAIILIVSAIIFVNWNNNSGRRISAKLSSQLGSSAADAQKAAGIELAKTSDFTFINDIDTFNYIHEASKTIKIDGVNVPEWIIVCHTDTADGMQRVSYYDYTLLEKSSHGIKAKGKISTDAVTTGMTRKQVEKAIGLEPLVVANYADGTQIRKYKYYYNDKSTKSDTSYFLTVMFDKDDKVTAPMIEESNVFITDALTCKPSKKS